MEKHIKDQVIEELKKKGNLSDGEIKDIIIENVIDYTQNIDLDLKYKNDLTKKIFNSICGYDILQVMLEDEAIDEIMVNGHNKIFYEKNGEVFREERKFENLEQLENIVQSIAGSMNKVVNQSRPIVDVRLEDGSRVNIVLKPIAVDGPIVTIRKFNKEFLEMEDLLKKSSITSDAIEFLKKLVRYKYNIFISGGTSSGKTTFLNLLSGFIPSDERIVTIEDSAELNIVNIDNLVRLETRENTTEGYDLKIDIRTLIKTSLRMRPDRIIVGEVRGGEAFDMLTAMNTGHDGSMSTGHANSARDMLLRILTMVMVGNNIREDVGINLIKSGIDIIVHLKRDQALRRVEGIYELEKNEEKLEVIPLFERNENGDLIIKNRLKNLEKFYDKKAR